MSRACKYKQLIENLNASIEGGEFEVGGRLPTEKDLAARYQVSVHTVRQALLHFKNNGVVRQVAGSGTYLTRLPGQPNPGQPAAGGHSHNIGVLVWNTSAHVFPRIIHSIEQEVFALGYHVIACSTGDSADQEYQILERLIDQSIRGLIISPIIWHERRIENYELLCKQGIPFVFINRRIPNVNASSVILNNESGAYRATRHLINLGHRLIGHVTSATSSDLTEDRVRGYRRAHEEAGLPIHEDLIVRQPRVELQIGYEAGMRLLGRPEPPTAVFCVNDDHSIGVVEAARTLGLKIPEQLSIVSFDNSRIATSYFPFGLDSVDYPAEEMGLCAVQELLTGMSRERWVAKNICLEPNLIVRQSSAPPVAERQWIAPNAAGTSC